MIDDFQVSEPQKMYYVRKIINNKYRNENDLLHIFCRKVWIFINLLTAKKAMKFRVSNIANELDNS